MNQDTDNKGKTGFGWSRSALAGFAAAVLLLTPPVSAQYANEPFFEWTVLQSEAVGIELAMQRLRIVEAVPLPYERQFPEVVENLAGPDFERFGGALYEQDPELAEYLFAILNSIAEAVEDGGALETDGPRGRIDVVNLVPIAWELLDEAYDVMIPPEIRDLPAFRGGVIAQLLLGEGGVAEGLEEAFVEKWEYANGWAATQRVAELWSGIADLATPEQQSDVDEMIVAFNAIYPSPIPPASFAGIDPEDAETPAQRMAGLLESVLDTALYSGRDQLRLISHLADLTATACDAYDAGDLRIGQGVIYAVYSHYGDTTGLGALIGLFAPEVNDRAMAAFRSLVTVEDATPGTTPAVQQPVMAEEPVFPFARWLAGDSAETWLLPEDRQPVRMPGPEACAMLHDALVEGRTVLGG